MEATTLVNDYDLKAEYGHLDFCEICDRLCEMGYSEAKKYVQETENKYYLLDKYFQENKKTTLKSLFNEMKKYNFQKLPLILNAYDAEIHFLGYDNYELYASQNPMRIYLGSFTLQDINYIEEQGGKFQTLRIQI